jgi:glycosyltransferase involved in cell wall biosynthesis
MGQVLKGVAAILANSNSEERALRAISGTTASYFTVPNGIDPTVFHPDESHSRNDSLVISAARIEGIKNQLNLIRALNDTEFTLWLVGSVGPNHRKYDEACRREAAANIHFKGQVSQDELAQYYQRARIHALPSWFETCGLSSLEAAACGCNIVITEKGYTRDYFGEEGFYCDPSEPASIYEAVKNASRQPTRVTLQKRINDQFTWSIAATKTLEIYKQLVNR